MEEISKFIDKTQLYQHLMEKSLMGDHSLSSIDGVFLQGLIRKEKISMKILHTSDWHLGRSLYGKKRYEEFEAFLNWLSITISEEKIEVLLVAGDIFDTTTPSNQAQALYYKFLCRVATSCCRHIVIIAGNHDSPSFLNAPKELLLSLNVHVVAAVSDQYEDELIVLSHPEDNAPEVIICAVPFLRDRDVRQVEVGESIDDKELKLIEGIKKHYAELCELAEKKQQELEQSDNKKVPIIAMGHLFTAGGATIDGDGVRELYVGSIAHVSASIFPDSIDYLALGHLHVAQKINQSEVRRYSGSPIAMGFGEATQKKIVCCIEFNDKNEIKVVEMTVPKFQHLVQIKGDWEKIAAKFVEIKLLNEAVWVEVIYQAEEVIPDLQEKLEEMIVGTEIEILRITNKRIIQQVLQPVDDLRTLDDLNTDEVFAQCLSAHEISAEQQQELLQTYQRTMLLMQDEDSMME